MTRLAANEGRSQQAIGELMGLNPTRMVFLVDELEKRGLVERTTDPGDARSRLLAVTGAGLDALGEAHDRMVEVFASTVADWSDDDIAGLAAALHRLREDYSRAVAEARVAEPEGAR